MAEFGTKHHNLSERVRFVLVYHGLSGISRVPLCRKGIGEALGTELMQVKLLEFSSELRCVKYRP